MMFLKDTTVQTWSKLLVFIYNKIFMEISRFFVKDIPLASLEEHECFTVKTSGRKLVDITTALSVR